MGAQQLFAARSCRRNDCFRLEAIVRGAMRQRRFLKTSEYISQPNVRAAGENRRLWQTGSMEFGDSDISILRKPSPQEANLGELTDPPYLENSFFA